MEQIFKRHNLNRGRNNMGLINEMIIENSALHCEEDLLSTTLLSIGCAVIITNKDGLITDLNASAVLKPPS
jgi:PAS domain-containing protein